MRVYSFSCFLIQAALSCQRYDHLASFSFVFLRIFPEIKMITKQKSLRKSAVER